ncbi:MAG: zinc ribbon domain-containing protein [Candidatus Methanoplasma sp.]|jgi:TM2 domain-containing membrane protein YozV|nr:zinc ribbon domain-containing protein [Candidatus Methanoplasma sp.]
MYCSKCGKVIQDGVAFCSACGSSASGGNYQAPPYWSQAQYQMPLKNTGLTVILAFLFTGLGHLYIGRIKRGVGIIIGGVLLPLASLFAFLPLLALNDESGLGGFIIIVIAVLVLDFAYWLWNIFDAHKLANEYNEALRRTGNPPW